MKKIKLVALICAVTLMLASCGNMDMMGIGNYSFNKIHIDTYGYSGCVEISSWIDDDRGIEVKTKDYGALFLSEGTYVMVENKCPICDAKEG